jgi:hypothetical protein
MFGFLYTVSEHTQQSGERRLLSQEIPGVLLFFLTTDFFKLLASKAQKAAEQT